MAISLSGDGTIGGLVEGWAPDRSITAADLSTGGPAWDSTGNTTIGNNLTVPGTLSVAGYTSTQTLSVSGSAQTGTMNIAGDLVIGGTLRSANAITAGGVIQIQTAVCGPTRQYIRSNTPVGINGLSINFTPAVATSKILIQAFISTNSNYVSAFGVYKNGQPTVSTSGFTNYCASNLQATTYIAGPEVNYMHQRTVTHVEPAGTATMRTYQIYGVSFWYNASYDLWINNRAANDMASFSHMIIYEIAQ